MVGHTYSALTDPRLRRKVAEMLRIYRQEEARCLRQASYHARTDTGRVFLQQAARMGSAIQGMREMLTYLYEDEA